MKVLVAAAVAFLVTPAVALAETTMTVRDVPLHGDRTLAAAASARFDLVGLHWRGPGSVEFRTRSVRGAWSAWQRAAPEAEDQPDFGTAERRAEKGWRLDDDLQYTEVKGADHSEAAWGARVGEVLRFLYPARRAGVPARGPKIVLPPTLL